MFIYVPPMFTRPMEMVHLLNICILFSLSLLFTWYWSNIYYVYRPFLFSLLKAVYIVMHYSVDKLGSVSEIFSPFIFLQKISELFALERRVLDSRVPNSTASFQTLCAKEVTLLMVMEQEARAFMEKSLLMRTSS